MGATERDVKHDDDEAQYVLFSVKPERTSTGVKSIYARNVRHERRVALDVVDVLSRGRPKSRTRERGERAHLLSCVSEC